MSHETEHGADTSEPGDRAAGMSTESETLLEFGARVNELRNETLTRAVSLIEANPEDMALIVRLVYGEAWRLAYTESRRDNEAWYRRFSAESARSVALAYEQGIEEGMRRAGA